MKENLNILRGELERLFSNTELAKLFNDYMGLDPEQKGLGDDSKAVFVSNLIDWTKKNDAVAALADAVMTLKKGMLDPRVRKIFDEENKSIESGDQTGEYKAGEKLLDYSMGALYRAKRIESESDNNAPALCVCTVDGMYAKNPSCAQRYLTGLRILKDVKSPSVPKIISCGVADNGALYSVFPSDCTKPVIKKCENDTLAALGIFENVAKALKISHEKDIFHGSLRAQNILVTDDWDMEEKPEMTILGFGNYKLSDAKKHNPDVPLGGYAGLAPEMVMGNMPDARADVYGLGILLFELLTGKYPFTGKTSTQVAAAHLLTDMPSVGDMTDLDLPKELEDFLSRLLAKQALRRPKNVEEVLRLLTDVRAAVETQDELKGETGTRDDIAREGDAFLENPDDEDFLELLESKAKEHNAWAAAVEIIEEAALNSEDDGIVKKLLLKAAQISMSKVKDYNKAEALTDQLLEKDPSDADASKAKIKLYKIRKQYDQVIEMLGAMAETAENSTSKVEYLSQIADIMENDVGDKSKALDYIMACLGEAGVDEEMLQNAVRLALQSDRAADLAQNLASFAAAAEAEDTNAASVFYSEAGKLYKDNLNEATYALSCYQKVLEFSPVNTVALEAVSDMYKDAQQWTELAQVTIRLAEATNTPSLSRDRMVEAARIYYEKLSLTDDAVKLLNGVLDEDRTNKNAAGLLGDILESSKDWSSLTALLEKSLEGGKDDPETVEVRFKLAELYEHNLDDLKSAQTVYEKIIQIDSKHLDSLKGLERIFARTDDASALKENLETQLLIAVTPRQRILLMERIAEMQEEEFKNFEKAIEKFKQICEIDNEHKSALIALARLYRRTEKWEELTDVLEKRMDLTSDAKEKSRLARERGEILKDKIMDTKRAAQAFSLIPDSAVEGDLQSLADTQEEVGNFKEAVATMEKMVLSATSVSEKIEIIRRIARLQIEKMDLLDQAASSLRKAMDLMPKNQDVLADIRKLYIAQSNYGGAVGILEKELELADGSLSRAEINAQTGILYKENMSDSEKAEGFFVQALNMDPGHIEAADHLSEIYRKAGKWEKALPLYQKLDDASDAFDEEKKIDLYTYMGEAYEKVDRRNDALESFKKVINLAGDNPEMIIHVADIAINLGEYELAKQELIKYQSLVGDSLSPGEKTSLLLKIGRVSFELEDIAQASKLARQVSVMDPDNLEARLLLADVHENRGDYRGMTDACEKILAAMDKDDKGRPELLKRTARVYFKNLKDVDSSVKLLESGLEILPDDRSILGELLTMYGVTKRYEDIIKIALHIAELLEDKRQISMYYLTIAKIYRRELEQPENAIKYFERTLHYDPTNEDAQAAIMQIMTDEEDWNGLEKHYQKMMDELDENSTAEEKVSVYSALYKFLNKQSGREGEILKVTEMICVLVPDDLYWQNELSKLYSKTPDNYEKAIEVQRHLISINPSLIEPYKLLYSSAMENDKSDLAFCAAGMLTLLNKTSNEEKAMFTGNLPKEPKTVKTGLGEDQVKNLLLHPQIDENITSIFSTIIDAVIISRENKNLKLNSKDAVNKDKEPFIPGLIHSASLILNTDEPLCYGRDEHPVDMELVATNPVALVTNPKASIINKRGLAFLLGQEMTLFRSGFAMLKLASTGTRLRSWLLASVKTFAPGIAIPDDVAGKVTENLTPLRNNLDDASMERLKAHVQTFITKGSKADLSRWAMAVKYSMDRTGLLLSQDINTAAQSLRQNVKDNAELADRIKALAFFNVSDEHQIIRKHLEINI